MKVKYTRFQTVMEIAALLMIIGMFIFVCIKWSQLPSKIPGHYNAVGEVDRWGSKNEIIMLPIVGTLLYLLVTTVSFFPNIWNMPVEITEANRERLYDCTRNLLIFTKFELLAIFFYITYASASLRPLGAGFIPIILLVVFGTIIYFIRQMCKIGKEANE